MDGYGYRRLVDSVSLPSPELPAKVGRTVVERGHRVAAEKPGAASRGRRHSFVAGTDLHHPTDRSLPMDAARCMVRDVSRACGGLGRAAGGGRNTFAESSAGPVPVSPRHGSPTRARGTWRRRSGWR